jgi:diguanylate cyclase (GGDEF)-like protein/PAS domain S-box-containing protein
MCYNYFEDKERFMYNYDTNEFISNLYEGVYIVDKNRKIVFWNSGSEHITGYKADEVVQKHCYQNILKHVDKSGKKLCFEGCPLHHTLQTGKTNENEVFLEHKLGYRVPVSVKTFPLYDDDNKIIAAVEVFTDMKFKENQYKENLKLKKIIQRDDLTKLYNRRYLDFHLNQSLEEAKEFNQAFGILFIDIDHFKDVNDTYGHNVGDQVLKVIAHTLRSNLRPNDLVGRWGGEEFIAIINSDDMKTIEVIAERLRQLSAYSVYKHKEQEIQVTVSIGGTLLRLDDTISSLIERADKNMYEAKSTGRNRVVIK